MSGRANLPGGAARKASQRRRPRAANVPSAVTLTPSWRPGDTVRWREYVGQFLRDTVDGQVEVLIGTRTYRVAAGELQRA